MTSEEYALLTKAVELLEEIAIAVKKLSGDEPVNAYGESFVDAIQNSHVRGLRGISTYDR